MILNYIIRFFARLFRLLIIPAMICVLFDAATGMITITAGTLIFMIAGYAIFLTADIFMSRGKEDDWTLEDIDYYLSPIKWLRGN